MPTNPAIAACSRKAVAALLRWLPKISDASLGILSGPGYVVMRMFSTRPQNNSGRVQAPNRKGTETMETLQEQTVNIDEQRRATDQSETVSQRKLNANRQNAKKSTGPRTPRGKVTCSPLSAQS
jgi:hypothetical protein